LNRNKYNNDEILAKSPDSPTIYCRGHQRGARGHQAARKDHVGSPRVCSKNSISMINVFANTKIIEGKYKNIFISEVFIKLVTHGNNRYTSSRAQFRKGM